MKMKGRWSGWKMITRSLPSSEAQRWERRAEPGVPRRGNREQIASRQPVMGRTASRAENCVNLELAAAQASAVLGGAGLNSTPPPQAW